LQRLPGVRLLDSRDVAADYTLKELQEFGHWPPWIVADLDGDGRVDVAAVVVRPGARPQFGVFAVHARTPTTVQWLVPLQSDVIFGVDNAADAVTPLFCIECDANGWYRWSGRRYEPELYAVGEELTITEVESRGAPGLYAKPNRDSRVLVTLEPCRQAIVRKVAGSAHERWYFVETKGRPPVRGWLPGALVAGPSDCIA
jgi:hypothetical protein